MAWIKSPLLMRPSSFPVLLLSAPLEEGVGEASEADAASAGAESGLMRDALLSSTGMLVVEIALPSAIILAVSRG